MEQREDHYKQDGKLVQRVAEEPGPWVVVVDPVRRLQREVDERQPHGQDGGRFPSIYREVLSETENNTDLPLDDFNKNSLVYLTNILSI